METKVDATPLLNAAQVAVALAITRQRAYVLIRSGALRGVRIGRSVRVPQTVLASFIADGGVDDVGSSPD